MSWFKLLGVTSATVNTMTVGQCLRALVRQPDLDIHEAQELVERLELLTGHPDIVTYLYDHNWLQQPPSLLQADLLAEVRLLDQLIDHPSSDGNI